MRPDATPTSVPPSSLPPTGPTPLPIVTGAEAGERAVARADALDRLDRRGESVRDQRLTARLAMALGWAVQLFWGLGEGQGPLLVVAVALTVLAVGIELGSAVRLRRMERVRTALLEAQR